MAEHQHHWSESPPTEELESLTGQEVIERYNSHAANTVVGTGFYFDELSRWQQERQNNRILALTAHMRNLTVVIAILTAVNIIVVVYAMISQP